MRGNTMKTCGGCTACCFAVAVREIDKRAWTTCPHVRGVLHASGPGCGIYPTRPQSCCGWRCMWLNDPDWPDDARPDRLGIVVDEDLDLILVKGEETVAAQIWVLPGHELDYEQDGFAAGVIRALIDDDNVAVLWRMVGQRARVFAKVADKIVTSPIIEASEIAHAKLGTPAHRLRRTDEIMRQRRK